MKHKFWLFGIAFLAILISSSFLFFGIFAGSERILEDRLFTTKPIANNIIIAAIDDESISKIGQWPWPRQVFADALANLNQASPKAVGIDVVFAENSRQGPQDDAVLSTVLKAVNYPVVFPIEGKNLNLTSDIPKASSSVRTLPQFLESPKTIVGHVNLITDPDGVVRQFPSGLLIGDKVEPVFSFAQALVIASGAKFQELNPIERMVFAGSPGSIPRISFSEITSGKNLDKFKDKIVIIGATASDLHDTITVPTSHGALMAGAEAQAQIANMLILGYRLNSISGWLTLLLLILAGLIPAFSFFVLKKTWLIVLLNLIFASLYVVSAITLFGQGLVVPLIYIELSFVLSFLGTFLYRYLMSEKQRGEMREVFSKYVSKEVLNVILENPSKVKLGGEQKNVTLFFSDIRGFTTISEKLSPTELVRVLNRYFTVMTGIVLEHGGVVDKYIGDAIMAFWGAPLEDDNQADKALQTSIDMLRALKVLNEELVRAGDPEINIGIGLYSGPAVVGNVGSDQRFDYTAMGDTVNAASRLESSNKQYDTKILISQSTKDLLKKEYPLVYVDEATVKGRVEPIKIYTLDLDKI